MRVAIAFFLLAVAGCRQPKPVFEYEPPVTTVTGGIEQHGGDVVETTTTTTLPPRPSAWQGPKRW